MRFLEFPWLRAIERILEISEKTLEIVRSIPVKQEKTMALLDDLEAKVEAVVGVEASTATLLKTIHDELVAARNDPVRVQAVIDKLATSSDALGAAVVANSDGPAGP